MQRNGSTRPKEGRLLPNLVSQAPSRLKTVSQRAEPFLYLITTKIEEKGLPLELALLPVVEKTFRCVRLLTW